VAAALALTSEQRLLEKWGLSAIFIAKDECG
jgi:hypothetical protein